MAPSLPFGTFNISPYALDVMVKGRILGPDETPAEMLHRVAALGADVEKKFFGASHSCAEAFRQRILTLLFNKQFVPSTPIMTNAGRSLDKPLSACTVPPVSLRGDLTKVMPIINGIRQGGMGTGYNFDECDHPIEILKYLNEQAIQLQDSGTQERPVGNMGVMSIYNPHIIDFITIKKSADADRTRWIFNLSVNIDQAFMDAVKNGQDITLRGGQRISAQYLFDLIAESAWACADPGLVFMDRLNQDNTTPHVGVYTTTAPCGEVGLSPGETCQFGYINCAGFLRHGALDYTTLRDAVHDIIQYLDDALQYSIGHYITPESVNIMSQKRKIGIGICGFADLLIALQIPYDSPDAATLLENMLSFINFESKKKSLALAKERSPFGAFQGSTYLDPQSFISRKYAHRTTQTVSAGERSSLDTDIRAHGLRNSTTVVLPPTGRSSLVFDTSAQVEPLFHLRTEGQSALRKDLREYLRKNNLTHLYDNILAQGSVQHLGSTHEQLAALFKTSTELPIDAHLRIVTAAQAFCDESVSKTLNLPADATVDDIKRIYMQAFALGLKGVTIYRDGSKYYQPKALK